MKACVHVSSQLVLPRYPEHHATPRTGRGIDRDQGGMRAAGLRRWQSHLTHINAHSAQGASVEHVSRQQPAFRDMTMSNAAKPLQVLPLSPATAQWQHQLTDGTHVLVRALGPADAQLERRFLEALSPASRRMRFFGQFRSPDEALVRRLVDVDQRSEVALAALLHADGARREIGVARYAML